ncbi:MAG: PaaX family transcriptional regulator C-terminal domain-containing protein [Anaerolineae bacterium]
MNVRTLESDLATPSTTEYLPVRTQFLIFTLFGDYVLQRGGKIWTSSLLHLLELLGVSERAMRSALSRMKRRGWIASQKYGRRSQYYLTPRGQALLERGQERIFEPTFTDWDGQWHVVVYSLPERKRRRRHALRKELLWLGFGRLAPGTWFSPHDRRDELNEFFVELGVEGYVDMFSGIYQGPASAHDLVHRCWDLEGIAAQYHQFYNRFRSEYQECQTWQIDGKMPDLEACFVRRFWLTHEYQSFPFKDPNLPTSLLPPDWIGLVARDLFDNYHRLLGTYANQYVDAVMNDGEPEA